MARGKNINLFLMDGRATGRIKCTLANWTGLSFKIPRSEINKCKDRDDLKQSGVYFLFGIDEETNKNLVYIGQAGVRKNGEGILYRLLEHKRNPEKDYWTEAVVFTTSDNSFGATEISYLESRFCEIAKKAGRYIVNNLNEPNSGNITEEKESELEEFIEYAKIIMGTLGHQVFEPLVKEEELEPKIKTTEESTLEDNIFYLKRMIRRSGEEVDAICRRTEEGFVVLKGSKIELMEADYIPDNIKKDRSRAKIDKNGILQEDILYKSPSAAGTFVIGANINGQRYWKNKEGLSLREIEKKESEL